MTGIHKGNRFSWTSLVLIAAVILIILARPRKLERILGTRLPNEAQVLNLHIERVPDYPVVRGFAKVALPPERWPDFVNRCGLATNKAEYLPTKNFPPTVQAWWGVPDSEGQSTRASRRSDDNERMMIAVYTDGFVYIEFDGHLPIARWEK
jgi:hypothetical protein